MAQHVESLDDDDEEDIDDEDGDGSIAVHRSSPIQSPEPKQQQRLVKVNNKIEELDGLLNSFPIGDGSGLHKVRIHRDHPKVYGGHNIYGHIGEVDYKFSMSDMQEAYGGGKYTVAVIGPFKGGPDAEGRPLTKQLKSVQVHLQGPPKIPMLNGEDMQRSPLPMAGYATQGPMIPQQAMGVAPQVQVKAMELEERRDLRSEEARSMAFQQSNEATKQALEQVKAFAQAQVEDMRQRIAMLEASYTKKDEDLRRIQTELTQAVAQGTASARIAEDARAAKEKLEEEIRRTKDEAVRQVGEIKQQSQLAQEDLRRRLEDDRNKIDRDSQSERDRIREDARNREQSLKDEMERRIANLKDSYEGRLTDTVRNTDREIASVREQRDREVKNIELQAKSEISGIKSSAETKLGILESDRARLQTDLDRAQKKYDELQRNTTKDTMTVIRESTELAQMVGFVPASEAGGGKEEEGEFDLKKMAAKGIFQLIEKAPEIANQIGAMRQQGAMRVQQAQQAQQMQQQRAQQAQQQQRQRPRLAPPPSVQQAPQQYGQIQQSVPGIMGNVRPASSLRPMYQPPPAPMAPPLQEQIQPIQEPPHSMYQTPISQAPPPMPQTQQPLEQPQMQSFAPPPVAQMQNPQDQASGFTPENIAKFIDELEEAIRDEVVPSKVFAQMLVQRAGPELTKHIIGRVSPEMLFAQMEQADTVITTRRGRQYVQEVWAEALKAIS